ncbi:hypothetical protein CUMW_034330 [Citrus unshiu]|nr:hypothetical protein CUMW_034330 [Citrus unshiu]
MNLCVIVIIDSFLQNWSLSSIVPSKNGILGAILNKSIHKLRKTGHLTPKSDVYSFGVVLLELLSGRRALDEDRGGLAEQTLVEWADPFLRDSRRVLRIMDTRLGGQYSKKEAQAVAAVVLQCLHMDPKNRPSMVDVLTSLEQLHTSKDMPRTPPPAKLHHHHHHHNHHQGIKHTNPPRKTSITNSK